MKNIATKVKCYNEYDILKKVIVVSPLHMQIEDIINETQYRYVDENININKAMQQHTVFLETLISEGIEIIKLKPLHNLNEQVFTRDIGFTIGDILFVSVMKEQTRQPEKNVLMEWLNRHQIAFHQFPVDSIEGGDVIIDNQTIWIGQSGRTSKEAIRTLKKQLPDCTINTIQLQDDVLHLDCVFNIIDKNYALIYPPAFTKDAYAHISRMYNLIEATESEYFRMGPNVLSIGNRKIISLPENKRLNKKLAQRDFHVIEVEFSEIIKSGGSFRCCTLPLIRD